MTSEYLDPKTKKFKKGNPGGPGRPRNTTLDEYKAILHKRAP